MDLIYCKMYIIDQANWGVLGDYLKKVPGFFFKTQLGITLGLLGELFIHYPEVHLMGQTHLDAHYQSWQQIILSGRFDLSEAQPCTEWRWSSVEKTPTTCQILPLIKHWGLASCREQSHTHGSADFPWTPVSPLSTSAGGLATGAHLTENQYN